LFGSMQAQVIAPIMENIDLLILRRERFARASKDAPPDIQAVPGSPASRPPTPGRPGAEPSIAPGLP